MQHHHHLILSSPHWTDYELVDSGSGSKLERFGPYCLIRPEPRATWQPALPSPAWREAQAVFASHSDGAEPSWQLRSQIEPPWTMRYGGLRFWVQPAPSGHVGVFPEQAAHWDWIEQLIAAAREPVNVLNLFGYTGLATLAAAKAGARVVHVDAARKTVGWARENAALSGLAGRPVRWIVDDALRFVQREGRRGATYDGFVIDPPPFGRGPRGEVWRLEKSLPALLAGCRALLSNNPLFAVLTAYATRVGPAWLHSRLEEDLAMGRGTVTSGELALVECSALRIIPSALFARWNARG